MTAVFPGCVGTLMSARMIRRSLGRIKRRMSLKGEIAPGYLTTDPVWSKTTTPTPSSRTFLHHRVMVVPIAPRGPVHAVVAAGSSRRSTTASPTSPRDYGD
jgi:hypothetical protein